MRRISAAAIAAVLLGTLAPSHGALIPRPGAGDPRIHVVDYDPAEVVELQATLGFQTFVEFSADERIENVAVGDATSWQITPNRKANLLFVKPLSEAPVTNMTVVTNLRRYAFELRARPRAAVAGRSIVYTLRFLYPEVAMAVVQPAAPAEPQALSPPKVANESYSYDGSTRIVPTRIFDDGSTTYFQFREGDDYPALFEVSADKGEAIVNSYRRGNYVVVDAVARGFVLRQGAEVTHIYNDGFRDTRPGPQSPKPRPARKCFLWLCR